MFMQEVNQTKKIDAPRRGKNYDKAGGGKNCGFARESILLEVIAFSSNFQKAHLAKLIKKKYLW